MAYITTALFRRNKKISTRQTASGNAANGNFEEEEGQLYSPGIAN